MNQRTRAVDIRRGILAAFVAAVAVSLLAVPHGAGADSGTTEALRSRAADGDGRTSTGWTPGGPTPSPPSSGRTTG